MLGENRSKAAFHADSGGNVQEVKTPTGNHEPVLEQSGNFERLQFGPAYPVGDAGWEPPERPAEKMEQSAEETPMKPPAGSEIPAPVAETEFSVATEEPEAPGVRLAAPEKARTLRTHDLFFGAEDKNRDFTSVLREVQAYLSKEYSSLVTEDTTDEVKAQIRRFAGKYIQDHRIAVEGMTTDQLIDGIYSEMAEFGFLTKYIYGEGIEEIDGATRS